MIFFKRIMWQLVSFWTFKLSRDIWYKEKNARWWLYFDAGNVVHFDPRSVW